MNNYGEPIEAKYISPPPQGYPMLNGPLGFEIPVTIQDLVRCISDLYDYANAGRVVFNDEGARDLFVNHAKDVRDMYTTGKVAFESKPWEFEFLNL